MRRALVLRLLLLGMMARTASNAWAARSVGIDVSHYQNTINWTQVAGDGIDFAWTKATEGLTYTDPTFTTNVTGGQNAGVYMGAYHYAHPESNSAASEAAHFVAVAGPYLTNGHFRPMLDIEGSSFNLSTTDLSNWINTFCTYVTDRYGASADPLIYMSASRTVSEVNSSVTGHGLDVAQYGTNPIDPAVPTGNPGTGVWNGNWAFWQYGSQGRVAGIGGGTANVDMDVANGDINFVRQFLIGPPAATSFQQFDVNGTTGGSGVTNNGSYTWEAATFSSSAAGTDPVSWNEGNFLRLAAGIDAAASNYTITANADHTFAGIFLQANGGGTVTINGPGVLSIASGDQGMYVNASSQNLKINAVVAGSGKLVWQGSGSGSGNQSGGSLFLLGNNTYTGGTALNAGSGVNFNNDHSFGTGRITLGYTGGTATQYVLANDVATAPVTLANTVTTQAGATLIYVGPAAAPVTFTGAWTLPSGTSTLSIGNPGHTSSKMTISGAVGGSGGALTKLGVGTLVLSGTNTYTGATTLNAGTLLVMNGTNGSATGTGNVSVASGATLGGAGRIGGSVSTSGIVAPGSSAGTLYIGGTYTQTAAGQLNIELASGSSYDALAVTGAASLAGNLTVSAINGYAPQEGDIFQILTASTLNSTSFNAPSLPALSGNLIWKVAYAPTNLTLSVLLPGDFDGSGVVDTADYIVWRRNVGQPAGSLLNDTVGGTISDAQLDLWRSNFGDTASAGSGSSESLARTSVPEPNALMLALIGGMAISMLSGWHRRAV